MAFHTKKQKVKLSKEKKNVENPPLPLILLYHLTLIPG